MFSRSVLLGLLILTGCKSGVATTPLTNRQVIEYKSDNGSYGVVVVQEGGMSEKEARLKAMQKAAEKTQAEQQRYFLIESEGRVQAVTASGSAYDSPPPPRNMYYELIQSDNFGRDRFEDERTPKENTYPAYRMVFKCYATPPSAEAIDSCEVVPCKGD